MNQSQLLLEKYFLPKYFKVDRLETYLDSVGLLKSERVDLRRSMRYARAELIDFFTDFFSNFLGQKIDHNLQYMVSAASSYYSSVEQMKDFFEGLLNSLREYIDQNDDVTKLLLFTLNHGDQRRAAQIFVEIIELLGRLRKWGKFSRAVDQDRFTKDDTMAGLRLIFGSTNKGDLKGDLDLVWNLKSKSAISIPDFFDMAFLIAFLFSSNEMKSPEKTRKVSNSDDFSVRTARRNPQPYRNTVGGVFEQNTPRRGDSTRRTTSPDKEQETVVFAKEKPVSSNETKPNPPSPEKLVRENFYNYDLLKKHFLTLYDLRIFNPHITIPPPLPKYILLEDLESASVGDVAPLFIGEVLYDFISDDARYLKITRGEVVKVYFEQDKWYFAQSEDDEFGFVSPSYIAKRAPRQLSLIHI
eukprot:TRINITY_DN7563_c0_g2_i5.p1 TRINITY_DN7563_c0_g2~~TRINITY_DN7563_c0_g2_i5.p1  ORF type:complete len:413 (-),score=60.88 TRINITY_DN7563_c0_g2_i5:61-1299(-)